MAPGSGPYMYIKVNGITKPNSAQGITSLLTSTDFARTFVLVYQVRLNANDKIKLAGFFPPTGYNLGTSIVGAKSSTLSIKRIAD